MHRFLPWLWLCTYLEGQLADELPGADVKVCRPHAARSGGAATAAAAAAALIAAEVI